MAGQTHMQRAAGAFVVRLCGGVRQYTVVVVELPTQRYDAALHPTAGRLAHKARVYT